LTRLKVKKRAKDIFFKVSAEANIQCTTKIRGRLKRQKEKFVSFKIYIEKFGSYCTVQYTQTVTISIK
jgi:hypothetical protein